MTLSEYITSNKPALQDHLLSYLDEKKKNYTFNLSYYTDVLNRIQDFACEGKMMRGILVLFSQEMFSSTPDVYSYNCASAIELAHSGLLVHDDIIDNDNLRRGKKTIFAQFEDEAKEKKLKNPHFYGQSMGICSGDIAFFLVFELLSRDVTNSQHATSIINLFSQTLQTVAASEMHDFHLGFIDNDTSKDEIMEIYRTKTAYYTFSTPLTVGATFAGADQDTISKLTKMGEYLGIVFQMKDDEIGITASQEVIGKPVGSDIRENKKTYVRTLLFESVSESEKNRLNTIFGDETITHQEIEYVKELLEKYRITEQVNHEIQLLSEQAHDILINLPISEKYKNTLEELIVYNTNRTS